MISRQNIVAITLLSIACGFAQPVVAAPQDLKNAEKLLQSGKAAEAASMLKKYLVKNPQDPEGRFLQGLAFAQSGSVTEAIEIFYDLTQDYPELPEPYNNLAVLYAQQQEYDKARASLMAAVKTHPAYSTAYENLGDIYAIHASMAYKKASKLGSSSEATKLKLDMLSRISAVELDKVNEEALPAKPSASFAPASRPTIPAFAGNTTTRPKTTAARPAIKPTPKKPDIIPVRSSSDVAYEEQQIENEYGGRVIHVYANGQQAKKTIKPASPVAAAKTPVSRATVVSKPQSRRHSSTYPKLPKVKRSNLPASASDEENRQAIKLVLKNWNNALNAGNQGGYFSAYGTHYESTKGQTLPTWQRYQSAALRAQRRSKVTLGKLEIELLASDLALINLETQSAGKKEKSSKMLLMENTLDGWKIIREEVLRKDARR